MRRMLRWVRHFHRAFVSANSPTSAFCKPPKVCRLAASDSSGAAVFTAPFRVGADPAQGLIFDFTDSTVRVVEGPRINGYPVWVSVSKRHDP